MWGGRLTAIAVSPFVTYSMHAAHSSLRSNCRLTLVMAWYVVEHSQSVVVRFVHLLSIDGLYAWAADVQWARPCA